jgi:serine protein kinase
MTLVKNVQFEIAAEEEDFFTKLIDEVCAGEDLTPWNGDLRQYLPMVAAEPTLNDLAHTRVWRMIEKAGIEFNEADEKQRNPKFKFFEKDLFGVDSTIAQIMQYLK